ncbi:MAG TPA: sulfatase-like hydrolase/transferase [Candidatus Angelobacter sp.]|nr:sulfatase-like hydrolase/transferase [Candidatus Angelobacter sp.]
MTRRDLIRGAATGMVALAVGSSFKTAKRPSKAPNIVFILADDLGYADVSCYGRPDLRTPNIDQIAAQGVRFLQAYANSAVCSATRVALITGRYQYRLRLGLEEPLAGNPEVGLPPEHPTLPSLLKKAGYGTTLIGKWHLGALPRFGPLKSGYDHFYGFRGGALDYFSHANGSREDFWDEDVPLHRTGYLTDLLGSHAVEVIQGYAKTQQPFLISLHFSAPHWPWEGPGDEAESERLRQPGSRGLADFDGGSQKTYQRMIEAMDRQIGRVLEALQANGLTENTIVIFTSDNGGERFADTWPFTGKKTELLEGGLRIPALISWPARLPRGRTTDQVSISMDWSATLLAAAGAEADGAYPLDGINLLPALAPNGATVPRKLFWRYKSNAQRAMRDGDYKFLKILDNTFLFNVVEDPLERANLKERQKDVYRRMVREWYEWNATMLPEVKESYTHGFDASDLADHYGAKRSDGTPDIPTSPDD